MFSDYKNTVFNNLFGENRPIFQQKRPTKAPHSKEAPKSAAEIREGLDKLLANLQSDDLFEPREGDKDEPRTHTDTQRHTRAPFKPEPYYDESVKIAERAVELDFRREANETLLLQGVHDNLYKQYMNPAFMMHLSAQPDGLIEKVYPALDMIMQHPDDFDYVSKPGGVVEIVKKTPYEGRPAAIANNFLVVMEGNEGSVTRVRYGDFDRPLKEDGKIPWEENNEFNAKLPLYDKLWSSTLLRYQVAGGFYEWYNEKRTRGALGQDTSDMNKAYEEIFLKALEEIGTSEQEIKEIYVAMNITFPQRFVQLVNMRGLQWEKEDPRVQQIMEQMQYQGKTYEDITKNGYGEYGKFRVRVLADPQVPGLYLIYTRAYNRNPLRVNLLGQILRQDEDGSWKPDPRYTDNVRRDYYYRGATDGKPNQDLLEKDDELSDEDKKRMADAEAEVAPDSKTNDRVKKMYELIDRRELVDTALYKEKDINKLRELSLYLMPAHKKKSEKAVNFIMAISDLKWHQNTIKRTLDDEDVPKLIHDRNDYVAGVLGVALPARKYK